MSCMDVLYQPYAAHTYQRKVSAYQTLKAKYDAGRHSSSSSSDYDTSGGKIDLGFPQIPKQALGMEAAAIVGKTYSSTPESSSPPASNQCLFATNGSFAAQPQSQKALANAGEPQTESSYPSCAANAPSAADEVSKRLSPGEDLPSCRVSGRKSPPKQRVNSRCVMFNYFEGNTSDEVDGHFSRALSRESKSSGGKSPMIKRKFPPSFWDSDYRAPAATIRPSYRLPTTENALGVGPFAAPFPGILPGGAAANYNMSHNPFAHNAGSSLLGFDHLTSSLDPFSAPSCSFAGFQQNLAANAAVAAAAAAGTSIGDPWGAYAGISSPISGRSLYSQRALYHGLSAAAMAAAAASHSLDQRYSSLLMQQQQPTVRPSLAAAAAAGLAAQRSTAKSGPGLWPVARYSGFRF